MSFSGQAVSTSAFVPMPLPQAMEPLSNPAEAEPAELRAIGTVCTFARNETVFGQSEPARETYKIISGVVRLCRLTADGRRLIAGFRVAGDFVGFECEESYSMSAEAVREVVAIRYSRARLDTLSREKIGVRDHLLTHLRRELRAAQDHLVTLGCQTAKERVAAFLLHLAERSTNAQGGVIDMQLGRQDIADYLGLTLETVSRTFSDLRSRGVIVLPKRRHVAISSLARLRAQTCDMDT